MPICISIEFNIRDHRDFTDQKNFTYCITDVKPSRRWLSSLVLQPFLKIGVTLVSQPHNTIIVVWQYWLGVTKPNKIIASVQSLIGYYKITTKNSVENFLVNAY